MDVDSGKKPSIKIDNGSYYIKSGFGNEEGLRSCIRNYIGYPKINDKYSYFSGKDYFIGKNAKIRFEDLDIKYPVKEGVIDIWDDMEKMWSYIFSEELSIKPEEYNVMITQRIMNPKYNKEKTA